MESAVIYIFKEGILKFIKEISTELRRNQFAELQVKVRSPETSFFAADSMESAPLLPSVTASRINLTELLSS